MNTLTEAIQNLPAESPSLFPEEPEVAHTRLPGLRIHRWNGVVWVLPWSCFIGANYQPNVGNAKAASHAPYMSHTPLTPHAPDGAVQGEAMQNEAVASGSTVAPNNISGPKSALELPRPIEQIELAFAHQFVVIQGRNLQSLMAAIADMSLRLLREIPQAYMEMEAACASDDNTINAGNGENTGNTGSGKSAGDAAAAGDGTGIGSVINPPRPRVLITSIDVQTRER